MDRLLSVKDIQNRYQCSPNTARAYIRQMIHYENPLMVTEKALTDWENSRLVVPYQMMKRRAR